MLEQRSESVHHIRFSPAYDFCDRVTAAPVRRADFRRSIQSPIPAL